jgi:hypothetical protein
LKVNDLTELPDHYPIGFSLYCDNMFLYQCDVLTYDKISLKDNNNNLLDNTSEEN